MTQGQLAQKLGVQSHHISRWENGHVTPSQKYILALCTIFAVTVYDLFTFRESTDNLSVAVDHLYALPAYLQAKAIAYIGVLWEAFTSLVDTDPQTGSDEQPEGSRE